MNGERKNRRGIWGCLALVILWGLLAVRTAAQAMELGGFDVEIGVGEQQELPEGFETGEWTEAPVEDHSVEEIPVEDILPEEAPGAEIPGKEALREELPEEIYQQDSSVEEQIYWELQEETAAPAPTLTPIVRPEPTVMPEPTVALIPTVMPEPTVTLAPTAAPTATPTPVPTVTLEPILTPMPTAVPSSEPTPTLKTAETPPVKSTTPSPVIVRKSFTKNGAIPSIAVHCKGAVQVFSFRVNGRECAWSWKDSVLLALAEAKKEENRLELLLVSPSGKALTLSHGR